MDALFRMDNFSSTEAIGPLLRASFDEVHAQSHVLADRSKIFAYHQESILCSTILGRKFCWQMFIPNN
jgi:hypothetical protein